MYTGRVWGSNLGWEPIYLCIVILCAVIIQSIVGDLHPCNFTNTLLSFSSVVSVLSVQGSDGGEYGCVAISDDSNCTTQRSDILTITSKSHVMIIKIHTALKIYYFSI